MKMSSNTVSVVGAGGMLGQAVVRALGAGAKDFRVHEITSRPGVELENTAPFVINCAGVVRGRDDLPGAAMALVNGYVPHLVAARPDLKRMVTVSTDCVFNGVLGPYFEDAQPTPTDLYARTKLAGEIPDNDKVLTVRTSFIGFGQRGLLRWFLTQPQEATVFGYDNRWWNGLYVETVAKALVHLCLRTPLTGLLHLQGDSRTKGSLLRGIGDRLRPDIAVATELSNPRNHILHSGRLDEFDIGVSFGTSLELMYEDYKEWAREYLHNG